MRRIIIDARDMQEKAALFLVMKEALNLPAYTGNNLDALWDGLMEIPPVSLYLRNENALNGLPDGYGQRLMELLEQARQERKGFTFIRLQG